MAKPYAKHPQLRGNFAPIRMECDVSDVIIRGELPQDPNGPLLPQRSGPSVCAPWRSLLVRRRWHGR